MSFEREVHEGNQEDVVSLGSLAPLLSFFTSNLPPSLCPRQRISEYVRHVLIIISPCACARALLHTHMHTCTHAHTPRRRPYSEIISKSSSAKERGREREGARALAGARACVRACVRASERERAREKERACVLERACAGNNGMASLAPGSKGGSAGKTSHVHAILGLFTRSLWCYTRSL